MIDPMATGTAKRPSADLHRPRGRAAPSAHPPTPVDHTPRESLEQRAENGWAPATLVCSEAFSDDEASPHHERSLRQGCNPMERGLRTAPRFDAGKHDAHAAGLTMSARGRYTLRRTGFHRPFMAGRGRHDY